MKKRNLDSFKHQGLRQQMIARLAKHKELKSKVLLAMSEIPRHYFVDTAFAEWVYGDKPFPIGSGQTISSPYTVAYQTSLLDVQSREKILEIGTGSGYQAAVLSHLGARVYTLERQKKLHFKAKELLEEMKYSTRCFYRDGFKGLPELGPFDKILVTAGADEVPTALKEQLTVGGKLVIPVGKDNTQQMLVIHKLGDDIFETEEHDAFRFVPFLKGKV